MTTMTINSNATVSNTTTNNTDLKQSVWNHLKATGKRIALAYTIYNERRALRHISDEALADMGLSRAQINVEIKRSAFDMPENRQ